MFYFCSILDRGVKRRDILIRIGTAFSGIGSPEHALKRLGIDSEIVFACDNGGVDPWSKLGIENKKAFEQKILRIKSNDDKKNYVDELYASVKRKNFVQQSYEANYDIPKSKFHQDINYLNGKQFKNKVDLLVGGSPCQSFSIVGNRKGLEDARGTLFYEYMRLVDEVKPLVFIYENVKGVLNHDKGNTWEVMKKCFDESGYRWDWQVLNAYDYGVPQSRPRVFVVGRKKDAAYFFPNKIKLKTRMSDFLLHNVPESYYLSEKGVAFVTKEKNLKKMYTQINGEIMLCQKARQQSNLHGDFVYEPSEKDGVIPEKYFLSNKLLKYVMSEGTKNYNVKPTIDTDIAKTLLSSMSKMHRAHIDNYVTTEGRLRRLTPRECLRLMGFCDSFKQVVSDTQMYKQSGNSIVVDVLMEIIISLIDQKFIKPNF